MVHTLSGINVAVKNETDIYILIWKYLQDILSEREAR